MATEDDELDGENTALEKTEYDGLIDKSIEEILEEGKKSLFARLVSKCRANTASHQELSILRNVLKDNGLTLGIPQERPNQPGQPLDLPELPEYPEAPEYGRH